MNISQYEALIKAIESGTLTKASKELGYTQSGITRALDSLEEQLGIRLTIRGRQGVQLTTEGQLLLPYIRTLLNDQRRISERIDEIRNLKEGLIRIGTFNSVSAQWLPGIIKEFHDMYPGVKFELLHGTDKQITSWISDGRVDLGLVAYPTRAEFYSTFLYRDPIVSIFSKDDPWASKEVFPISMLPTLPYIALNEGVEDEITAILDQNNISLEPSFMESDDHAVIAMVEQGLGTSLMSVMMLQGFNRNITYLPIEPHGYRDLGIACRDKSLLSNSASKFYDLACTWVKTKYQPYF